LPESLKWKKKEVEQVREEGGHSGSMRETEFSLHLLALKMEEGRTQAENYCWPLEAGYGPQLATIKEIGISVLELQGSAKLK